MDWGTSMPEDELRHWIELSRSVTTADRERHDPPEDLWGRIAAQLDVDDSIEADPLPASVIDMEQARTRRAPQAIRRHRRRLGVAVAAAAVVALVGLSALTTRDDAKTTFVAEATNATLPEPYDGSATASITNGALEISFSASLPDEEPLELWLIKPDLSAMVSLGLLDDQGSYEIPAGIDPSEYSLVDVSVEPDDGDPTHSRRSILRGELQAT